jgi:hypothetical protein
MFSHEIVGDPKAVTVEPRFFKVPVAVRYSGISRAKLYILMAEGQIKSASVRSRGRSRGIRLVDRLSLDEFLTKNITVGLGK